MDKWMIQADSAHQIGLEPTLHAVLILEVGCCTGGEEVWAEFFPSEMGDVLACITTTRGAIGKWRLQRDSARRIGLKPTLHAVLIVGW